jgi:hypothetical protein
MREVLLRSETRGDENSKHVRAAAVDANIEHHFTDFIASEIGTGYCGAQMQCPAAAGSGRKTQAVR